METGIHRDSIIGQVEHILSFGNHIILAIEQSSRPILSYNIETGQLQRFGWLGRGKNEIISINQIGVYPIENKSAFYLHGNFSETLFVYTLDETAEWELSEAKEMNNFLSFDLDSNSVIGTNKTSDSRYLLNDRRYETLSEFGDYAEFDKIGDVGEGIRFYKYGSCVVNPSLKRCAWFSYYGEACNIIDYSDPKNVKIPHRKVYKSAALHETSWGETSLLANETKMGFISLTGSDKHIMALCGSDGTMKELILANEPHNRSHDICIFDWNGKYVRRLVSDLPMVALSYNKDREELFVVILNEDYYYEVVSLPLKDMI